MPIVILDGPEAAGKTTIIDELRRQWGPDSVERHWGPRKSWLEYCQPLFDDLGVAQFFPTRLIVWSRCWVSRAVYNKLLHQGQHFPVEIARALDDTVIRSGGLLFLVTAPEKTLLERRMARLASGDSSDHPLDVHQELTEFQRAVRERKWINMSGTVDPETNARKIIHLLVQRNPECRMLTQEEPIVALNR